MSLVTLRYSSDAFEKLVLRRSAPPFPVGFRPFLAPVRDELRLPQEENKKKRINREAGWICQVRGQRLQVRSSREIFIPTALRPIFGSNSLNPPVASPRWTLM